MTQQHRRRCETVLAATVIPHLWAAVPVTSNLPPNSEDIMSATHQLVAYALLCTPTLTLFAGLCILKLSERSPSRHRHT